MRFSGLRLLLVGLGVILQVPPQLLYWPGVVICDDWLFLSMLGGDGLLSCFAGMGYFLGLPLLPEGAFGFSGLRFYWAFGFGDWAS